MSKWFKSFFFGIIFYLDTAEKFAVVTIAVGGKPLGKIRISNFNLFFSRVIWTIYFRPNPLGKIVSWWCVKAIITFWSVADTRPSGNLGCNLLLNPGLLREARPQYYAKIRHKLQTYDIHPAPKQTAHKNKPAKVSSLIYTF